MSEKERKLQYIIETEKVLNEIQDIDILLERILTETRKIVNADAGSIYVVAGKDNSRLQIKYAQNDTQLERLRPGEKLPYEFFDFPINEKSIAGYVAFTGKKLAIEDAYEIPSECPFKFNDQTDVITSYRTKSIYTIPLKMANGFLLGVLQVINAQDIFKNVIEFNDDAQLFIDHFATSAVQALQAAYNNHLMIKRMLKLSELHDPRETYPHIERVSTIAVEIYDRWAVYHKIPKEEQHSFRKNLKIAAKYHDIGKVGISDVILKKPGRFTSEERNIIKGHTCLGAMIFEPPESPLDVMSQDIALHHHERWDGAEETEGNSNGGYPGFFDCKNSCTIDGNFQLLKADINNSEKCSKYVYGKAVDVRRPLKGTEIPLAARIVAVADVFDALSHKRCYKEAWTVDDAFAEIEKLSGKQFDPEVVFAFMKIKERIRSILLAIPDDK